MVDATDAQMAAAEARGLKMLGSEARAARVEYDRTTRRVVVDLVSGCTYAFPTGIVEDLQGVEAEVLAEVEIDGMGFNLHWPRLDVDLYVPSLLAGVFGTQAWMAREYTRIAGLSVSTAKIGAGRPDRAKSSRPGKIAKG